MRYYFPVEDETGERFWIYRRGENEDAATGCHRLPDGKRSALAVTDHNSLADGHLGLKRQRPGDYITCLDANAPGLTWPVWRFRRSRGWATSSVTRSPRS